MSNRHNERQVKGSLLHKFCMMVVTLALCLAWTASGGVRTALADESSDGAWEYTLDAQGQATITAYKGKDASVSLPPDGDAGTVTGKDGAHKVVAVGVDSGEDVTGVFEGSETLEEVKVYAPLASLGNETFKDCTKLRTVMVYSADLQSVGASCFEGCTSLENVIYGADTALAKLSIAERAFRGCTALTRMILPANLDALGGNAFADCGSLSELVFASVPGKVAADALSGSRPTLIAAPEGWTQTSAEVGAPAQTPIFVYQASLRASSSNGTTKLVGVRATGETLSITVPRQVGYYTVAALGDGSFADLSRVQSISFEDGSAITAVGDSCFRGCSALSSLTLPSGVASVGERCFAQCASLTTDPLAQVDGLSSSTLPVGLYAGCTSLTSVQVPAGITAISDECFSGDAALTSVSLPSSVSSLGSGAFAGCASLSDVALPNSQDGFSMASDAFAGCDFSRLRFKVSVGSGAETRIAALVADGTYSADVLAYEAVDLSDASVSLAVVGDAPVYDGQAHTPTLEGARWGHTLVEGKDFSVSTESSYTDAGEHTVVVNGDGVKFSGSREVSFEIARADISGRVSAAVIEGGVWDGQPWTPTSTWTYTAPSGEAHELAEGEYELSYADNVSAGTATVAVHGAGNYTGSQEFSFDIAARDLSEAAVAAIPTQRYTGEAITPKPEVSMRDRNGATFVLEEGADTYALSYANNVATGTATVTITAQAGGSLRGTASATFEIGSVSLADATIAAIADQTYAGKAITPQLEVTYEGEALREGTDFTVAYAHNVDAGKAEVTLTGKGGFTGSAQTTFTIVPAELKVTTGSATKEYDGKELTESTAKLSGIVGDEKATVKATGTITEVGETPNTYAITWDTAKQANYHVVEELGKLTVTAAEVKVTLTASSASKTYDGKPLKSAEVKAEGLPKGYTLKAVAQGAQTAVGESKNVVPKDYQILDAQGKDCTASFTQVTLVDGKLTVTAAKLDEKGRFTVAPLKNQRHTGEEVKPKPVVTDTKTGKPLTEGTDCTFTYAHNVELGKATVTVTGKGNYQGTLDVGFEITAATYEPSTVTEVTYTKGDESPVEISFTREGDDQGTYKHFKGVEVDGKAVPEDAYEVRRGSVVIVFKDSYLQTLATGSHTVKAVFDDGSAEASLVVAEAVAPEPEPEAPVEPEPEPVAPKAGGIGVAGIVAGVAVAAACLTALAFVLKDRRS